MSVTPPSAGATPAVDRLVWLEKGVGRIVKAKKADTYAYTIQDFDDSPDYLVGGPMLSNAGQATATNAFQKNYAWAVHVGRVQDREGRTAAGALYYPAGYEPGASTHDRVRLRTAVAVSPHLCGSSERSPYNAAVFTPMATSCFNRHRVPAAGSGIAAVDCVTSAVKAVLAAGAVDPKRVGLVGHSWGGYEASFIPTQTNMFAASIAGAPITNFLSFYAHSLEPGPARAVPFRDGQARMEVRSGWTCRPTSATPRRCSSTNSRRDADLLRDKDGTVDFRQGVEMYNYARRPASNW